VSAYASCIEVRTPKQRVDDAARLRADGWKAMKLRVHNWTIQSEWRKSRR
jgi:hypothetical protein